jgi:hypothetical protein
MFRDVQRSTLALAMLPFCIFVLSSCSSIRVNKGSVSLTRTWALCCCVCASRELDLDEFDWTLGACGPAGRASCIYAWNAVKH